jgi:hypothetical protein
VITTPLSSCYASLQPVPATLRGAVSIPFTRVAVALRAVSVCPQGLSSLQDIPVTAILHPTSLVHSPRNVPTTRMFWTLSLTCLESSGEVCEHTADDGS